MLLALGISSGVYFSIRYGLQPKPIPQLNPTVFDNPEQVGVVTYHALRPTLRQERVLVIGSSEAIKEYDQIWSGFVKAAQADGVKVDIVFQRDGLTLPTAVQGIKTEAIHDLASPELLDHIKGTYQRGELALIHVKNVEATHLIADTITRRLQQLPNLPVVSISMLPLAVNEEAFEQLQPHCVDPRSDVQGENRFWCSAARISLHYLRKRLPPEKWVAAIERHGLKEFLLFVSVPH